MGNAIIFEFGAGNYFGLHYFFGAGQRHMTIRCWRVLLICRCWKVPCLSLVLGSAAYIGAGGFHVGY